VTGLVKDEPLTPIAYW